MTDTNADKHSHDFCYVKAIPPISIYTTCSYIQSEFVFCRVFCSCIYLYITYKYKLNGMNVCLHIYITVSIYTLYIPMSISVFCILLWSDVYVVVLYVTGETDIVNETEEMLSICLYMYVMHVGGFIWIWCLWLASLFCWKW